MTLRKFFKLAAWFCGIGFWILCITIYYINFIYPDSRPPHPSVMKKFLIETKSEAWLEKRIDEGKTNYEKLVQKKRKSRITEMQALQKTLKICQSSSDAYRMKNSYECNKAWKKMGGSGEFKTYMKIPDVEQEPKFVNAREFEDTQEKMIDKAIVRDCISAKSIRHAREIGCYY